MKAMNRLVGKIYDGGGPPVSLQGRNVVDKNLDWHLWKSHWRICHTNITLGDVIWESYHAMYLFNKCRIYLLVLNALYLNITTVQVLLRFYHILFINFKGVLVLNFMIWYCDFALWFSPPKKWSVYATTFNSNSFI